MDNRVTAIFEAIGVSKFQDAFKKADGAIRDAGPKMQSAGTAMGKKLLGALKTVLAAAAVGKIFKDAIEEGAKLQQSRGGVETLFQLDAKKVKENADKAFETVGVSANEYMETVTGFSASLIGSLKGDTQKAANIADMIMVDMADNANKMGTDMGAIQNAYSGFAKQNYTMLDNLKLGYGGTKKEMQRLLDDANKINASQGKSTKYTIDNFADISEAIHVVQEDLKITGTTSKEASETFTGSLAAVKAAAQNLMGKLALGENFDKELDHLVNTAKTFLFDNALPMIMKIASGLPTALVGMLEKAVPVFLEEGQKLLKSLLDGFSSDKDGNIITRAITVIQQLAMGIMKNLPMVLKLGVEIIKSVLQGITNAQKGGEFLATIQTVIKELLEIIKTELPNIIKMGASILLSLVKGITDEKDGLLKTALTTIETLISIIVENLPLVLDAGLKILLALLEGIIDNLPQLIKSAKNLIVQIVKTIVANLPLIITSAIKIISALVSGIAENLPLLIDAAISIVEELAQALIDNPEAITQATIEIVDEIVKLLFDNLPKIFSMGEKILGKLVSGITGTVDALAPPLANLIDSGLAKVREFGERFREAGRNIINSIKQGIEDKVNAVTGAISGVAEKVRNFLPFSPAKEGPLKDLDKLNFGGTISYGIEKGKPEVSAAMNKLLQFDGVNASVNHNLQAPKQNKDITLNLGGKRFRAFVNNITDTQDKEYELIEAYT